jgi:hypothetical protein
MSKCFAAEALICYLLYSIYVLTMVHTLIKTSNLCPDTLHFYTNIAGAIHYSTYPCEKKKKSLPDWICFRPMMGEVGMPPPPMFLMRFLNGFD